MELTGLKMSIYYTSLTGMFAASYGLQNASNNLANMNSPGFKRKDVFYSSLGNSKNQANLGQGVRIGGSVTNFTAGHYLETGNPTDLAIIGQGFFIVKLKNSELVYTRDGEFIFNQEGLLTDKHSGGLVQGYNEQGNLVPIQQFGPKTHVGKPTRFVELAGEFILNEKEQDNTDPDPQKSNYESIKFTINTIFDAKGKEHPLELEFKPQGSLLNQQKKWDALEWELIHVNYDGVEINIAPQSLKFSDQLNGAPLEGNNFINLNLPNKQLITLKFGDYMTDQDKSVRLNKADTTKSNTQIKIHKQDGYGEGKPLHFSFDENGQINYHYDNGQVITGLYLALAKFDDLEHDLIPTKDNLFRSKNPERQRLGRANEEGLGSLEAKKIESSNVDSTTEFANIVVLQRMFQACSQIMEIDKQLLEELYKK